VRRVLAAAGGPESVVASVYPLCGDSGRSIALAVLPTRDLGLDYGWRLVLMLDSAGVPIVTFASHGAIDSYRPSVRVFRAGAQYLVLAQRGDEGGSWGIETFEVRRHILTSIGTLDVGRPSADNDQPNLDAAQVDYTSGGWRVGFPTTVVLWPNQAKRKVIRPAAGQNLWLSPAGAEWHLQAR
jgi:hypothetical protein